MSWTTGVLVTGEVGVQACEVVMSPVPLNAQCNPHMTLETAHALHFRFAPADPWRSVVVWRDRRKTVRPVEKKRLRDLRPGDEVIYHGRREKILAVEIYR